MRRQIIYVCGRVAASAAIAVLLIVGGCGERDATVTTTGDATMTAPATDTSQIATATQATNTASPAQAQQAPPNMRLEVNLAKRELYVYRDGERVETHPVAVGSKEWPTPTGEWNVNQVVWNPEWVPPDEEWAKDEEGKQPGDPDNPLGRAQLVYNLPNTIHGTNDADSIGKAVSHGSIRMSNDAITDLARKVMEAGGSSRDESWYQSVRENRTQKQVVDIPNPIPIKVVAGEQS